MSISLRFESRFELQRRTRVERAGDRSAEAGNTAKPRAGPPKGKA